MRRFALLALAAAVLIAGCGSSRPQLHARIVHPKALTACASADCGQYAILLEWSNLNYRGATGYYLFANGSQVGTSNTSPFLFYGMDCGTTFTLGVQAHDAPGNTSQLYTTPFTTPPCPPANTGLPVISGATTQGSTLTTTNGTWTGPPTSFAYQWQDCNTSGAGCTSITGATASSYVLQAADVGHTIRVSVTASNVSGSASAVSAATATVTSGTGSLTCNTTVSSVTALNSAITSATVGQVICLNSGDYSGWTASTATKISCCVTITSAPGAAVTFNSGMTIAVASAQNFTLDGTGGGGTMTVGGIVDLETSGNVEQIKALNYTFQNLAFPTGRLPNVLWNGPENANVTFNRDWFVDGSGTCVNGNSSGQPGNFYVFNAGTATTQTGLTVENSVLVAPMDLWDPGRTVQDGAPMAFENNVLAGYVDHTEAASCTHIDGLQWFSGTPGTTGSVTFTGNLCYDDYGCALAFDGTSSNTLTDNACFDMERSCATLYSDSGSVMNHNTYETGGADPGFCNTMHEPNAPIQACTITVPFENGTKGGVDPNPTGETYTNNASQSAPSLMAGSTTSNTNNVWSGAASPNISGTPTFAGGSNPTTWAGFELTAGSTGHAAGSDGLDVGIRSSNGGPPTGGGSAPANTAAPALTGTATNGSTLTTTTGAWTITGGVPTATTYQWFDCTTGTFSVSSTSCSPIQAFTPCVNSGGSPLCGSITNTATNADNLSTYTISTAGPPSGVNVGDFVFAMVTMTNANGQVNAVSNAIGPVS